MSQQKAQPGFGHTILIFIIAHGCEAQFGSSSFHDPQVGAGVASQRIANVRP